MQAYVNRSQQFFRNTAIGYALIAANIVFTLLSIPLALRYLGKEEFGLWALAQQIGAYFLLLDLGLAIAMSRLLANHKDEVNGGAYGSLLLTGTTVFGLQGVFLFALGSLFALFAPTLFAVPTALAEEFRNVIVIVAAVSGATLALRSITAPLWAFQRLDVSYGMGIVSLSSSLVSLWIGFHLGWGVYSFAFSGIPPLIISTVAGFEFCRRSGLYPERGSWGRVKWEVFCRMFAFGKDVMLISLGNQLVNASQIMILGRMAGLEAAATFAVGTKFYTLGTQLTGRLIESSAPALTEMVVQGDVARLRHRFVDIYSTSLSLAAVGSVALVAANAMVVDRWTAGVISWNFSWDLLLGLLLLANTASRSLVGLFGIAGDLRPVRNLYLVEAALFVALGIPAAQHFGIAGLLSASLVAHLLVTGFFSATAARRVIGSICGLGSPILTALILLIAATFVVSFLPDIPAFFRPLAAALVILVFSLAAGSTILAPEVKGRIFKRILNLSLSTRS